MNGIINIYKEKGYTSHDVVAKARGILKQKRIGHTGTLDPDAEGVLPICVGMATKVVPYLTDANKSYIAKVILGTTTTTEDATGEVISEKPVNVTQQQVKAVVKSFLGEYKQVPPMYSAIKINGVRLYELARQGKIVERPERTVQIFQCEILEWCDEKSFMLEVTCSKGTYIRTLCTDIGEKLGCGAHMGSLVRTRVAHYLLEKSIKLSELERQKENAEKFLEPIEQFFSAYPKCIVPFQFQKALYNGNPLPLDKLQLEELNDGSLICVYDAEGEWIGIYSIDKKINRAKVQTFFKNN